MAHISTEQNQVESLLSEIFIAPANTIKTARFTLDTSSEAGCSGQCASPGGCKTII